MSEYTKAPYLPLENAGRNYFYYISTDFTDFPPHVFITFVDPGGTENAVGFAPQETSLSGPGEIFNNSSHPRDVDGPLIQVSADQYNKMATFVNANIDTPPFYDAIFGSQCSNWVSSIINFGNDVPINNYEGYQYYSDTYVYQMSSFIATIINNPYTKPINILFEEISTHTPQQIVQAYHDLAQSWPVMNFLEPAMRGLIDLTNPLYTIKDLFNLAKAMYSPLVLDLNGDGVHTTALNSIGAVYFDHDHNGTAEASGWVAGGDGLLCIDVNKNGLIDNGTELFGNQTGYANGFLQLASYDNNGDGKITAEDIVWKNLKVWVDANGNGIFEAGELKTLDQLGITSINSTYSNNGSADNGNTIGQVGTFTMNGTAHNIDDVYFAVDTTNTSYQKEYAMEVEALFVPWIRGYGLLPDLYVSMSLDNTASGNLLSLVQTLSSKSLDDIFAGSSATRDLVKSIMYRWAGVDGVAASSRGGFVDGRSLGYLEKLLGQEYLQAGHESNPRANAAPDLNQAFTLAFDHAYAMLLGQTAAKAVFAGDVHYDLATDSLTGITGLNTSELTALQTEAKGLASTTLRDAFWGDAVRLIEYGFGTANLSSSDKTALNNAIYNSDHTLSLSKVLTDMDAVAQNPVIEGTDSANTMTGTTANETMNGHGGSDILTGGKGDDLLQGGSGSDTYKYNKGDGKDIIFDDGSSGDTDKILFGAGITASNITLSRTGDQDIRIAITTGTTTGEILVSGQFHTIYSRAIETLQFNDGSTINLLTKNWVLDGTSGDDLLNGVRAAGGANDTIFGHDGNDAIYGGEALPCWMRASSLSASFLQHTQNKVFDKNIILLHSEQVNCMYTHV